MITLTDTWSTEMNRSGVAPIWMVAIHCRSFAAVPYVDHVFRFVSGDRPYSTYENGDGDPEQVQNSIDTITNLSSEIDPLTRALSIQDTTITFVDDQAVREILDTFYIAGNKIELFVGSHGLPAIADFQKVGTVYAQELQLDPGQIGIQCNGAGRVFEDTEIMGEWYGYHPLEMIDMCMQSAGLDETYYDRTTLDATALSSKTHWVVTRADSPAPHSTWKGPRTGIKKPVSAKKLVDELTGLMGGTFAPDLAGVFKFTEYNGAAASVVTWTEDDIDEFDQAVTWSNMINDYRVKLSNAPENFQDDRYNQEIFSMGYTDTNSQTFFGSGATPLVRGQEISSPWLNGFGTAGTAFDSGGVRRPSLDPSLINTGDYIWIGGGHVNGITGTYVPGQHGSSTTGGVPQVRSTGTSTAPTGGRAIGAGKLLYLAFVYFGMDTEIISFDQADQFYADGIAQNILDPKFTAATVPVTGTPPRDLVLNMPTSNSYRLRVKARGALGTATKNWPLWYQQNPRSGSFVWDATIAQDWAQRTVSRFSQGAAVVSVTTNLTQLGVEIGDFVRISDRRYANQFDGFGDELTTAVWEVTSKELRITEDTPCIAWQLVFVRYNTPLIPQVIGPIITTPTVSARGEPEIVQNNALENVTAGDSSGTITATGLGIFNRGDFE